ncbi:hypothetical protein [Streptomyces sp. CB01881]|uniref:hypothetical protein n=1 Tax=Streptomyces sp. CB01881 TaxID=2078691 RepID=UPI000CDC7E13|nr:hypothetical protein [Streptomyces sp. CB01881]AUY50279.1 hypothetical protein C2142_16560 [Streptomyces sp. CB01881]TYC73668.1 hypothetical protein EH183_16545 [Streptomyces sp. CB01881]
MSPQEQSVAVQVLLAEYTSIKDEQKQRIGFRDNLIYATLASLAAVLAATLQSGGHPERLLLLPPVTFLLGWTYLINDHKISSIGRYIRGDLAPRLAAVLPGDTTVFGWEASHLRDERRTSRKYLQLASNLLVFCLSSATAIVLFWAHDGNAGWLTAASVAEFAGLAVLASQVVRYADLRPHGTG